MLQIPHKAKAKAAGFVVEDAYLDNSSFLVEGVISWSFLRWDNAKKKKN